MKALEKRKLKDLSVTFLGFGALEIGRDWGFIERSRPKEEEALLLLKEVVDSKINIIDTASAYHLSEERIGKFIDLYGKNFILTSKCGEHNKDDGTFYDFSFMSIYESIQKSLKLLKVKSLEAMQIHFGPGAKEVIDNNETLRALKKAKEEGLIKYIGASIDGVLAKECILSKEFDLMQMTYNLLDTSNYENLKLCEKNGIGVLIKGPFAQGKLTLKAPDILKSNKLSEKEGKKLESLLKACQNNPEILMKCSLRFLYEEKAISSVLAGTKNINHFKNNLSLLENPVQDDIYNEVKKIAFNF